MGYYTRYELEAECPDGVIFTEIVSALRKENEDADFALDDDGTTQERCQWYDHQKDLTEFSKKYPGVLFILSGEGEDPADMWRGYAKDGKWCKVKPEIRWPQFFEALLK